MAGTKGHSGIYIRSEEHIKKLKTKTPWNKGLTKENDDRILNYSVKVSKTKKGSHLSDETRNKIKLSSARGENHHNWKGGITKDILKRCNSIWWKELRKRIYERDNWTCQKCNKKCYKDIQCHHIIPEREGGTHKEENLITLCRSCHMIEDNILKFRSF